MLLLISSNRDALLPNGDHECNLRKIYGFFVNIQHIINDFALMKQFVISVFFH